MNLEKKHVCHFLFAKMELTREAFRAMIYYDYKRGLTYKDSHENLTSAFGALSPSLATVSYWFREFKRGRSDVKDEPRPGRPPTAVTPENVIKAEWLIKESRNITHREIQDELKIGSRAVSTILHDHLQVRKLSSRWIPHFLTQEQKDTRVDWCKFMLKKLDEGDSRQVSYIVTSDESWIYSYDPFTKQQSTQWVFEEDELPTKVVRGRSVNKKMVAVFFRRSGPVAVIPLEDQKTVTSQWYSEVCLPQAFQELNVSRPSTKTRGIIFHQDNAPAHTAARTMDFLSKSRVQLLPHPAYSPDLAPCDFFLFPTLKKSLRGRRFSTADEAVDEFRRLFFDLPQDQFFSCFESWFSRMHKCINVGGEYFEKL